MNAHTPARNIKGDATFRAVCNQRDAAMTTLAILEGEKAELSHHLDAARFDLAKARETIEELRKSVQALKDAVAATDGTEPDDDEDAANHA